AHCILPLSGQPQDQQLGTRHRAALGLSEQTDALVVVVSEETGRISVAVGGRIEAGVEPDRLRELLLTGQPAGAEAGRPGRRRFRSGAGEGRSR
ncbi:MAG: DNA integrity scanning protein DisA nucleotide-binding domain protein, partial [Deltaproteobacteria bacterium]|nr:DNA integrity scanning protein DisA nucleotide-binding domain protein [Deltaproteobacteria bacterium]